MDEESTQYLGQYHVMSFLDTTVKQLMEGKPKDCERFLYDVLKRKYEPTDSAKTLSWVLDAIDSMVHGAPAPMPPSATPEVLRAQSILNNLEAKMMNSKSGRFEEDARSRAMNSAMRLVATGGIDETMVVQSVVFAAMDLLRAERCAIFIVDHAKKVMTTTIDGRHFTLRFGQGVAGCVAMSGKGERLSKPYEDPRFEPSVDINLNYVTRDILCHPIHCDGRLVAVAQLVNRVDGEPFCAEDEDLFSAFAQFAGVGLRNAAAYKESLKHAQRHAMIAEVSHALANLSLDSDKLVPVIIKRAKELVGADRCSFFLIDNAKGMMSAYLEGLDCRVRVPVSAEESPGRSRCRGKRSTSRTPIRTSASTKKSMPRVGTARDRSFAFRSSRMGK